MSSFDRELNRLQKAKSLTAKVFPRFGINKTREIIRLICEISRREEISFEEILKPLKGLRYPQIRLRLLKQRYPRAAASGHELKIDLPALNLSFEDCQQNPGSPVNPQTLVCEHHARDSVLTQNFRRAFPQAEFILVNSIREHLNSLPREKFSPEDYNRRKELILIGSLPPQPFLPCPCTQGASPCGYQVFNQVIGCPYDCTYCFLQEYINTPGIFFPVPAQPDQEVLTKYAASSRARAWQVGKDLRIGTGEFSDSLAFDALTGYSRELVRFFRGKEGIVFEFKTKSDRVDSLLQEDPGSNIVVGFSLAPPQAALLHEHGAASPQERIAAAARCAAGGYRLAFHFDPVILTPDWEDRYRELIEELFRQIDPAAISWFSLGTLRFYPRLKVVLERRFPGNPICDAELFPGYDGKLRYLPEVRVRVYRRLVEMLTRAGGKLPLYLCMEDLATWKAVGLENPFKGR